MRGTLLCHKLENLCYNIVEHVKKIDIDRFNIKSMILLFKIGEKDVIWLDSCCGISVNGRHNIKREKNKLEIGIPDYIN
jgi:hypothetical protein